MPTSTRSLRQNTAFRLLIGGSSVSMLGSRLTTIAYPMLALCLTSRQFMPGLPFSPL